MIAGHRKGNNVIFRAKLQSMSVHQNFVLNHVDYQSMQTVYSVNGQTISSRSNYALCFDYTVVMTIYILPLII